MSGRAEISEGPGLWRFVLWQPGFWPRRVATAGALVAAGQALHKRWIDETFAKHGRADVPCPRGRKRDWW